MKSCDLEARKQWKWSRFGEFRRFEMSPSTWYNLNAIFTSKIRNLSIYLVKIYISNQYFIGKCGVAAEMEKIHVFGSKTAINLYPDPFGYIICEQRYKSRRDLSMDTIISGIKCNLNKIATEYRFCLCITLSSTNYCSLITLTSYVYPCWVQYSI